MRRLPMGTSRDHVLELLHAHRELMQREQHIRAYLTNLAFRYGLTDREVAQALEPTTTLDDT